MNSNKRIVEVGETHLGQVAQLVGVQQQFLQTPSVAVDLIGHEEERAVAFIDRLDVTVAPPQGYTVKHDGEAGRQAGKREPRAVDKQRAGRARTRRSRRRRLWRRDATDCTSE